MLITIYTESILTQPEGPLISRVLLPDMKALNQDSTYEGFGPRRTFNRLGESWWIFKKLACTLRLSQNLEEQEGSASQQIKIQKTI